MVSWRGTAVMAAVAAGISAASGVAVAGAAVAGYVVGSTAYSAWRSHQNIVARRRYLAPGVTDYQDSFDTQEQSELHVFYEIPFTRSVDSEDELIAPASVTAAAPAAIAHQQTAAVLHSSHEHMLFAGPAPKAAVSAQQEVAEQVEATVSSHLTQPDMDLANFLVHVAGEAYSAPPPGQGYRTSNIVGLPALTLYDKELLVRMFAGVLKVELIGAHNLRRSDGINAPDAYAVVSVAAGSFRTPTCRNSVNPSWNMRRWLYIENALTDALCVRVFDDDYITHHDDLGIATLGLGDLVAAKGQPKESRLGLRGPNGEYSFVMVRCQLLLFRDPVTGNQLVDPANVPELKPPGEPKGSDGEPEHGDKGPGIEARMRPVAFVDDKQTDTQVWVRWKREERKLVCAFRGTESLKDIITDIRLIHCEFRRVDGTAMRNVRIHRGVMAAYSGVRRLLARLLHTITMLPGERGQPWELIITGHSLGGALATLAAFEVSMFRSQAGNISAIKLYTFGSPRVGNSTFATEFDQLVPDTWRFTNTHDIVPSVPPSWLNYRHVGHPVRLEVDSKQGMVSVKFGPNNVERDKGQAQPSLVGSSSVISNVTFAEKSVQDIRSVAAAISRRGIKEHICSYYAGVLDKFSDQEKMVREQGKVISAAAQPAAAAAQSAVAAAAEKIAITAAAAQPAAEAPLLPPQAAVEHPASE